MYEEAEPYFKKLIPLYKQNSGRQGDTKAHLAYIYLRTGRLKEAGELIKEAILDINKEHSKRTLCFYLVIPCFSG